MIRSPFLILILLAAAASKAEQNDGVEFRSGNIVIHFDGEFHKRMRWLADQGRGIVAFDPSVQEIVEVNGWECSEFRVDQTKTSQRRVVDPEFGPGVEGIVAGVLNDEKKGIHLERRVHVLLPDNFPDVAIFQNWYRNLGTSQLHLGRVYSQRVLLDRKLAEPEAPAYEFASFQGGAYAWGRDYALIPLKPDFSQLNFQGLDDRTGPEGEGGGMPFVDVWGPTMGVALAHLEKVPQWVWMPVQVRADRRAELAIWEKPMSKFRQPEWLRPEDTYSTVLTAVIFHRLDFYDALKNYGELLRARGIAIPRTSPPSAYEPYWKSWGYGFDVERDRILGVLPELKSMGIRIANLDDGWFDNYGDWQPNRSPSKFPQGDRDIIEFVRQIHAEGFKTNLWWYPLGVSPESRLAKEHPELLVQDEFGGYPLDQRKVHQLCPAFEPARQQVANLVKRFVGEWDFDGLYLDTIGLSAVPPCFNPAHNHRSPLDSFQSLPKIFALIYETLHQLKADPWLEVCICAMPHSPYNMPYYHIANASDPVNPAQVRRRIKLEKAIRGPSFCVGDCYQVPFNEWAGYSVPQSFESAIGTGAQLTTFYNHLTDAQLALWQRWFHTYRELGLSRAEYVNLYDLAFDHPEMHVVRKGAEWFFGIFADLWPVNKPIELRGLTKDAVYEVYDYGNRRALGRVSGAKPFVNVAFKDSLLLRVKPVQ